MSWSWLPNAITLARVLASLPLLWLLMRGEYVAAFWLALVAGASDAIDGILAKSMGWQSVLGGILDPIADKLLLSVCFFGLWWSQQVPPGWLLGQLVCDACVDQGSSHAPGTLMVGRRSGVLRRPTR